uniref:Peptidase A1 domain-containing protein n=1 Tax=Trichuris muris TaxID=70415 RepID=A0A5S6Q1U3_TRIMR
MYEKLCVAFLFNSIVSSVRFPLMPMEVDLSDSSKGLCDTDNEQPLSQANVLFYAEMKIGTPFQSFRVLLDTSTSLSYVTTAESDRSPCKPGELQSSNCSRQLNCERNRYTSEKSETAHRLKLIGPNMEKQVLAGTHFATDVVCLGKLCAKRTPFMLKSKADKDITSLPCDGVLGLAHQTASKFLLLPVIEKLAVEDKIIDPSFTIWTKDDIRAGEIAGFLTIGEADTEHCTTDYQVLPVREAKYWQFDVQQVIRRPAVITRHDNKPLKAIMNSGQNLLAGRPEIIEKMVAGLMAEERKDLFYINCSRIPDLPTFKFDLTLKNPHADVKFLILEPNDYAFKIGNNCFLAFSKKRKVLEADLEFGTFLSKKFCQTYKYGKGANGQDTASIVLSLKKN